MSTPVEGAAAWRASIERQYAIRAPNPADPAGGNGQVMSPWQALMTQAALSRGEPVDANTRATGGGWQPRIEQAPDPARTNAPPGVKDRPDRVETAAAPPTQKSAPGVFETGEFSLSDVIDVINPLQHIPIVSTIYRELTGDQIGHAARMAGGVLFMGPLGGLTAMANILVQESSGKDIGEHALAMFKDDAPATMAATASAGGQAAPAAAIPTPTKINVAERALAELLPPDAVPLPGRRVEFAAAAPPAKTDFTASAAVVGALPPPPPPVQPLAGPSWQGFYNDRAADPAPVISDLQQASATTARRAIAPDPMAALASKRTPGSMATAAAHINRPPQNQQGAVDESLRAMSGAISANGGWFSDVMIEAMAKYQDAQRLRTVAPANGTNTGTPGGTVNVIQ